MKKIPLVSVIVASYNYQYYIKETLDSMIAQTYQNFEVLVIDDGSKDDSINVIREYEKRDSRIKLYQHENGINRGLAKTVKLGVDLAKGEYIAFCESDDSWDENHLQAKIDYINKFTDADIIVNYPHMVGDEDLVKFKISEFDPLFSFLRKMKTPQKIYFKLLYLNGLVFSTFSIVMVKSESLRTCNFDSPTKMGIDLWLWNQLLCKSQVGYVDVPFTHWRLHSTHSYTAESFTSTTGASVSSAEYFKLLENHLYFSRWERLRICLRKYSPFILTRVRRGVYLRFFWRFKTFIYKDSWFNKTKSK